MPRIKFPERREGSRAARGPGGGSEFLILSQGVLFNVCQRMRKPNSQPPGEFRRVAALCNPSLRSGLFFTYIQATFIPRSGPWADV